MASSATGWYAPVPRSHLLAGDDSVDRRGDDSGVMAALIYELSFKGAASPTLRAAFSEFELESGRDVTWVRCQRSRLSAVTALIEDLGLELVEIRMLARSEDTVTRPVS